MTPHSRMIVSYNYGGVPSLIHKTPTPIFFFFLFENQTLDLKSKQLPLNDFMFYYLMYAWFLFLEVWGFKETPVSSFMIP